MKNYFLLITVIILVSCKKIETKIENSSLHKNETKITVSKKSTNVNQKQSINRPKECKIINSKFDLKLLFGIWTYDYKGPHADFELTKKSFYVVDYDGDGNMPYIINQDTIKVYYDDFVSTGLIKNVSEDTLKIDWDENGIINYVKWKG